MTATIIVLPHKDQENSKRSSHGRSHRKLENAQFALLANPREVVRIEDRAKRWERRMFSWGARMGLWVWGGWREGRAAAAEGIMTGDGGDHAADFVGGGDAFDGLVKAGAEANAVSVPAPLPHISIFRIIDFR